MKTFLIGDSLAFDFGEVAAVRDYFRRKGLVKVHTPWCGLVCTHGVSGKRDPPADREAVEEPH